MPDNFNIESSTTMSGLPDGLSAAIFHGLELRAELGNATAVSRDVLTDDEMEMLAMVLMATD